MVIQRVSSRVRARLGGGARACEDRARCAAQWLSLTFADTSLRDTRAPVTGMQLTQSQRQAKNVLEVKSWNPAVIPLDNL